MPDLSNPPGVTDATRCVVQLSDGRMFVTTWGYYQDTYGHLDIKPACNFLDATDDVLGIEVRTLPPETVVDLTETARCTECGFGIPADGMAVGYGCCGKIIHEKCESGAPHLCENA